MIGRRYFILWIVLAGVSMFLVGSNLTVLTPPSPEFGAAWWKVILGLVLFVWFAVLAWLASERAR